MQHQLQTPTEPTSVETLNPVGEPSTVTGAGEALNLAQAEDREWRVARRSRVSVWIRKTSRLGLMSEAASRVAFYSSLFLGMLALFAALVYAPLGGLVGLLALLTLLTSPLLFLIAWIIYIGLGTYSRWAKHEAILDDLPTRRPLLWPGAPRPK